jgi:hypothetical protein
MLRKAPARVTLVAASVLLAATISTAGFTGCTGLTTEITLNEEEINSILADSFPITESYDDVLTLTLENPRVVLEEGSDRMVVGVDASVVLNVPELEIGATLSGSADLETGVDYKPDTGEIILKEPSLVSLTIEGIPQEYTDIATDVANEIVSVTLDGFAIYKIEPEDFQTAIASITLKGVKVENGVLVITLGL